ncbi:kinesin-like protein KIF19 [Amia ocellicauda]|uniref:kinesin-like protein KIF19 n=1 Tax=Amia ocellicauda TaxID=2972642 RepID=UPI003464CBB1
MKTLAGESKDQQLMVAIRIRPISDAEVEEGATVVAHKVDDQMVVLMDPCEDPVDILRANRSREKTFMFDFAFNYTASQEDVYVGTTRSLIEGVISGYNATVFAYGPTGAGKTFTMLGTDAQPGIYIRTLNDLFRAIAEGSEEMDYSVYLSYLEIYNEMIRDLLNPDSGFLELREDAKGEIQITGITEFSTNNAQEIMQLLTRGNRQRTQEPTAANRTSSRSHAVLQVRVRQQRRLRGLSEEVRVGKLFMIDLAGTERASQTLNRGKRMKEGAHINRSLLALGNCINALSDRAGNRPHFVNYRDSKLTRLLKDSLGGNSRTVMIAHISPASMNFEESRTTLIYADRAKNIRTKVKRNLLRVTFHMTQYSSIVAELRREIERLQAKVQDRGSEHRRAGEKADIREVRAEVQQLSAQYSRGEVSRLREQLVSAFREQMEIRRSLVELENSSMELHIDTSRRLLTIADWEREKARCARKWQEERNTEKRDRGKEEERESGSEETAAPEPPEVTAAREEIGTLLAEQRRTTALKAELEDRLAGMRLKSSKVEELLPRRMASEEQREVLTLLCRVHELEVENSELQASLLGRDTRRRHQDSVLQHYEQQRALCPEIIEQQRALIAEHNIPIPERLQELYALYLHELEEGSLEQLLALHNISTVGLQDWLILSVAKQLNLGDLLTDLDQEELSPRTELRQDRKPYPQEPPLLPALVGGPEGDAYQGLRSGSKPQPRRRMAIPLPPLIQARPGAPGTESLREIATGTKSIAVIAAERRSRLQAVQPHPPGPAHAPERSLEEGERAASEPRRAPGSSSESLAAAAPDKRVSLHAPAGSYPRAKRDPRRVDRRDDKLRDHKRRSRSFEASGQRKPKSSSFRNEDVGSVSDSRLLRPTQNSNHLFLLKNFGTPPTPPAARIKYPVSHHTGESRLQELEMRGTPPSTVHQRHAEGRRGQVLHKRVRGPAAAAGTSQLLRQPGTSKRAAYASTRRRAATDNGAGQELRAKKGLD